MSPSRVGDAASSVAVVWPLKERVNVPVQWFQVGPEGINNGQTPGSQRTTGRITGSVADPRDPNIIYVSTAGGGAWKTIDGGKTWRPLFDAIPEIQTIQVNTTGDATSTLLKDCASSQDKFFILTSANAIITVFNQIGTELSNLRVAK